MHSGTAAQTIGSSSYNANMKNIKEIPGMPGYWASKSGHIYSTKRGPLKRKSERLDTRGRLRVCLSLPGGMDSPLVCKLVLLTFVGPCPKGLECCHYDGDQNNNRLSNLRWDTRSSNQLDRVRHGRSDAVHSDERHPATVLTDKQVLWIRKTKAMTRCSNETLALRLGVSTVTVSRVVKGTTYRDVGGPINDTGGKLSAEEVMSIRKLRGRGAKLQELADRFNVSLMNISNICSDKTYRDVA